MRYLFSPQGESVLNRFIVRDTLLAFDFDGTLAPIVPHPDSASTPTSIGLAMKRLCEIATVAIITGRSVQDIRERLGFTPKYIVGNHGAEGLPGAAPSGMKLAEVAAWESQILAAWESLHADFLGNTIRRNTVSSLFETLGADASLSDEELIARVEKEAFEAFNYQPKAAAAAAYASSTSRAELTGAVATTLPVAGL